VIMNMVGERFGKLRVMKVYRSNSKGVWWLCLCQCGNQSVALTDHLQRGLVQSCGCLRGEGREQIGALHGRL